MARCPRRSHQARSATARVPRRRHRAPGLEKAIATIWDGVPVQRCTVHKHRNLLASAPERLHEEIGANYNDMIYAATPEEIGAHREGAVRKWRLQAPRRRRQLKEAGDRLFIHPSAAEPVAPAHTQQTPSSGCTKSEPKDQNSNHAAFRRHCRHAVLGRCSLSGGSRHAKGEMAGTPHCGRLGEQMTWPPENDGLMFTQKKGNTATKFQPHSGRHFAVCDEVISPASLSKSSPQPGLPQPLPRYGAALACVRIAGAALRASRSSC